MTRKDYQAIAAVLREVRDDHEADSSTVHHIAFALADMFARENPRFDRDRFLVAAGTYNPHTQEDNK